MGFKAEILRPRLRPLTVMAFREVALMYFAACGYTKRSEFGPHKTPYVSLDCWLGKGQGEMRKQMGGVNRRSRTCFLQRLTRLEALLMVKYSRGKVRLDIVQIVRIHYHQQIG